MASAFSSNSLNARTNAVAAIESPSRRAARMLCAAFGATGSFGGLRPEVQAAADLLLFLTAAGRLRRRLNQTPAGRIVLRSQMPARTSGARVLHIGRRRSRPRRASPLARSAGKAKRRRIMHRRSRRLAQEGTRTPTALRPLVPETSASTNSATWARQTRLGAAHIRASKPRESLNARPDALGFRGAHIHQER